MRYDRWHDGHLTASELQPFRLQHWSLAEFAFLLSESGFGDITVTADYRQTPPGPDSDDWTFHATRA